MLNAVELGEYIDARLTHSAFRLETLDHYDDATDGADVARYLRGEPGPDLARKQPWLDRLRHEKEAGILNQRVHVLRTPLTDYLRYECEWGYRPNARFEDIRVLDLTETPPPAALVDHDFWIVDNQHGLRMHYDPTGRFEGAEPVDDDQTTAYRRCRDAAVATAEPFLDWWARHPEEWRANRAA
ncbi:MULTISPECIES: DUF6879 family protein [Pseudofrankia]|uniref:DUF6879 family protein n=1 Tax=Pseudofrankia TaxID=2994363 RepID=UPI000234B3BD|nr:MULTISPECIES: DUF6879 family protein [Pseudofrankia]OHV29865.1 hypothetical protein BCD49_35500 [Pseudofrankia sp. EUN1h]